ncbi:MAG: ISNCY family transposase [Cyanobacteria bacterium P01_D01_bin.14]
MASSVVSFRSLKSFLDGAIREMADPRAPSNATSYSLHDALLGAFGCFFMQSASFLDYQRQLNSRHGKDNAQSLFGLEQIPSIEQIRNILDRIPSSSLSEVFAQVYGQLHECGYLRRFEVLGGHLLVALDGTEYSSSQSIGCCCSTRKHHNGLVTYSHKAILPTVVSPHQAAVVSLAPVFITPQDGHAKQDSEPAAAKRWLKQSLKQLTHHQPTTLLGDDLYSRQPMCEAVLAEQADFIFTCLRESHPVLYDWIDFTASNGNVASFEWQPPEQRTDEVWRIRYLADVPLNDSETPLSINWCELTVRRTSDECVLYRNSWVTSHRFDSHPQVIDIVRAGRSRWKTENENHNVLKTKGYHLDHNFGHGQANLSSVLLSLNLLAFLFHTVLEWSDRLYQQMRQRRGTRKGFFQDILALTKYLWFESWTTLLEFRLDDTKAAKPITNSS